MWILAAAGESREASGHRETHDSCWCPLDFPLVVEHFTFSVSWAETEEGWLSLPGGYGEKE